MKSFGTFAATTAAQIMLPENVQRVGVMFKSVKANTDDVFFGFVYTGTTATTASGMPLSPGESIFFGTEFPTNSAAEYHSAITVQSNSGTQDVRFIEF